jgi:GR25 family glycosyltransferase involved in LPS biosynthesis
MIDKIYIISLEPEKEADSILNRLNNLGVPEGTRYEIIPAFDGRVKELPENYDLYSNWNLKNSGNCWWDRDVLPGEAGCMISHIQTWHRILEDGVENALVLEEDFKSRKDLANLNFVVVRHNYDIAVLGRSAFRPDDEEVINDQWVKPLAYYNSHAYILNKSGAKKMLGTSIKDNLIPADEFISACQSKHQRKDIKELFPPILNAFATREEFISQTSNRETSTTEEIIDQPEPEFEILNDSDWNGWVSKYIHPIIAKGEWDLMIDDFGDNIYEFPLFTERFCRELIAMAEAKDNWTENRHEFYPTNDVLLEDIGIGKIYNRVLKEFVYPLCVHVWELHGDDWLNMNSENFMSRYTPDKQAHLSLHHDFSNITAVVKLNDEFDGGGTWFPKYNKLSNPKRVGTATLHPGMVTHLHGARPIYSGRRYITVSFMKKP